MGKLMPQIGVNLDPLFYKYLLVITIEDKNPQQRGMLVLTIEDKAPKKAGLFVITLDEGEAPWEMDIALDASIYSSNSDSGGMKINLEPGTYEIIPTGGAVDDQGANADPSKRGFWTWHLRTPMGDIGGFYSCTRDASEEKYRSNYATTPLNAFATVSGQKLEFTWRGGLFSMWNPASAKDLTNNTSSLLFTIRKTG